jgi:hypothetical protein
VTRHIGADLVEQHQHVFSVTMAEVEQEDGLPFVLDKAQAVVYIVVRDHPSNPSTTL